MTTNVELEEKMGSFDITERLEALKCLAKEQTELLPEKCANVNMHFHSFFSYNAENWSPSRIAWEARKAGLLASGLCDFDVLDGLEEFIEAGKILGLRVTANLETRAYLKEFAEHEISSPGEPGVTYIMGGGFASLPQKETPQYSGLLGYKKRSSGRNIALINRINLHVSDIAVDYEKDVLPLTPAMGATERHIIRAYTNKAKEMFAHPDALAAFWSDVLNITFDEAVEFLTDLPALEGVVRAKFAKRGGYGYEQPSENTFPSVDDFVDWVTSCEAIPMATWLDGTSAGEADAKALLECLRSKGVAALNIIPDRNWNYSDQDTKTAKMANLKAIVETANAMNLPINIGTEMNKGGLPFVDDLDCEALRPYKDTFISGAFIMVGHTNLLRYADYSYIGKQAASDFNTVQDKNDFFEAVGKLPPMNASGAKKLEDMGPEKSLNFFRDQVRDAG